MLKLLPIASLVFTAAAIGADHASVRVERTDLQGPRQFQSQTESAVIRDYLQSWQSLNSALDQNRSGLLNADFVGTARDKFEDTIHQQATLGIHTKYQDRAHDIQIVFYSPDGLSVQLIDMVDYDMQVLDHDNVLSAQRMHAKYIAVLTPADAKWKVRILQSGPPDTAARL